MEISTLVSGKGIVALEYPMVPLKREQGSNMGIEDEHIDKMSKKLLN